MQENLRTENIGQKTGKVSSDILMAKQCGAH